MSTLSCTDTLTAAAEDGATGATGAVMRGPQAWGDCDDGYEFKSGATGESWKDVVLFGEYCYECATSHTKTATNDPLSDIQSGGGLWKVGQSINIVATYLIMAAYGLIENLGVSALEMKDSDGNVLVEIKDGAVVCKTGTFENVSITGSMKGVLDLAANYTGSIVGANLLYIPSTNTQTAFSLPVSADYVGRSIQLYNASSYNKTIYATQFNALNGNTSSFNGITYNLPPLSTLFFTCFSCPTNTSQSYSSGIGGHWIIVNRYNTNAKGYPLHVLAMGQAYGTSSGAWISNQETYDDNSLSISRNGTGNYTVSLPYGWFSSSTDVQVILVGMGWNDNATSGNPMKATLISTTTTSFTVALSDDGSENEGKFQFIVIDNSEFSLNT